MPEKRNGRRGQVFYIFLVVLFLLVAALLFLANFKMPVERTYLLLFLSLLFFLSFTNTDLALIILIFAMLFSPEAKAGALTTGRAIAIRVDDIFLLVIFSGWLAKMAINKELGIFKVTPLNLPINAYMGVCVFSSLLNGIYGGLDISRSFFFLLKYFEYIMIFYMVVNQIKSVSQAKRFIFFILLTCFLVSVYTWVQIPKGTRPSAPFEEQLGGAEPNTLAGYLLLMSAVVLGMVLYAKQGGQQVFFMGFFAFVCIPFLYTLSRSGWLGFFPMVTAFLFITKKFRVQLVLLLILCVLVIPFMPQKMHKRVHSTFDPEKTYSFLGKRFTLSESAGARIESLNLAFEGLKLKPFFGQGVPSAGVIDNQYALILRETGLVGFFIFSWLMLTLFRVCGHTLRACEGENLIQGLSAGFSAGLVGLLVMSVGIASFVIVRIMEPFWFMAAIVAVYPELQA